MSIQHLLFMSILATVAYGFSFLDPSIELTPDEESRIYGGTNANIKKHQYIASLLYNGTDSDLFCGGTLISPEFILTAGHCLEYPMINVYASLGSKHKLGDGSTNSEMIKVVEAFRHPSYESFTDVTGVKNDVALLKLETPSKINPARLPVVDGSQTKPNMIASAFGWGTINDDTYSDILQTVDVKIITNRMCTKMYAEKGEKVFVDDSLLCAGIGDGKDVCFSDGGGPLITNGVVVGIVSTGQKECGTLPAPYARVTNALDFINDVLDGKSTGNNTELLTAGENMMLAYLLLEGGSN